jgi:hypothetical protein
MERLSKLVLNAAKPPAQPLIDCNNMDYDYMDGVEMGVDGGDGGDYMEVDLVNPTSIEAGVDPSGLDPVLLDLDDLFHFIPLANAATQTGATPVAQAGLEKHRRTLDETGGELHEVVHETAGKVIRVDSSLRAMYQDALQRNGGKDEGQEGTEIVGNFYSPFDSEMDWRVARWAVMEGVGQGSLDRLLAIPGVSWILQPFFRYTLS